MFFPVEWNISMNNGILLYHWTMFYFSYYKQLFCWQTDLFVICELIIWFTI